MNLQRITRIQVLAVWFVLAVTIALVFTFSIIAPQRKRIGQAIDAAQAAEAEAARRSTVERQLAEAEARGAEVDTKYQKILDERMPELDFSDPISSTLRMWDLADEEQRVIEQWFAGTGARVTGYSFPGWGAAMPGSFPNPEARILDPLNWTLTVEVGSFPELLDWLLKLPRAPRFMVMHSVNIQGPRQAGQPLVATVPVTLYQWTGVLPHATVAAAPSAVGAGVGDAGAGMGMGRGGGMRGGGMRGGRGGMRGGM